MRRKMAPPGKSTKRNKSGPAGTIKAPLFSFSDVGTYLNPRPPAFFVVPEVVL